VSHLLVALPLVSGFFVAALLLAPKVARAIAPHQKEKDQ
jgi:hypothetical protein